MACCPPASTTNANTAAAAPAPAGAGAKVHIHLQVGDLAASVNFYRAFFGCEPVKLRPGYAKFLPAWGPVNLALSQAAISDRGSAISHLGLQLATPADLARQLQRVRAAGLPLRVETGVDCCHANSDKFWVIDPAGIEWEVYHLNYDLAASAAGTGCTPHGAISCCPA
ncbi:MAG: VOC family protein [Planctomycetes bacterium]|nr:VOC family protein [Planctomycetota bacterium]